MPYTGWVCLAGTPIWDNCATLAYLRGASEDDCVACADVTDCGCCPSLHAEDVYTSPVADPAPWYDPAVPESERFYGLLTTRVTGLGPGEITREIAPRSSGIGGLLGRAIQAPPVITVTGLLFAADCCAADFGLRWLTSTLVGPCPDNTTCAGGDLGFYTCCPEECTGEGDDPCGEYYRVLKNVALTNSPTVLDYAPLGEIDCACVYEVEFQLGAANPCQYSDPVALVTGATFEPDTSDDCRFEWVSESECADAGCQPDDPCFVDPGCAPSILPPQPSSPMVCGACDPWELARVCVDMETGSVPLHAEGVPIISIHSGANSMRSTTIRFFPNPLGAEPLDECSACSELTITRIPPESTLTIDGVNRAITLSCAGGAPADASRLVVAGGGVLPFSWPVISCPGQIWTICAETDGDVVAEDATIDISIVAMECG